KFWARLHKHFSEPELVEIGYFVALTMGQQRWLRTLDIEHHQILAGTDASMAPGFETEDALKQSKQDPGYWARRKATPSQAAECPPWRSRRPRRRWRSAWSNPACVSASTGCSSATARSRCFATSHSTSATGRSSQSSGRAVAARRRCCAASTA